MKSLVRNLNTAAIMLVLLKCFALLRSSCSPAVSRLFRSYHSRSTQSRLCVGFHSRPPAAARTGLLSSQDLGSYRSFLPADRCETCSYRGFSTSPNIRSDPVGKIQSTHYHLIYTCKVTYQNQFLDISVTLTFNKHSLESPVYFLCLWF